MRMKTNCEELLWLIYDASYVTTGTMDDAGYLDFDELTLKDYKQIDDSRSIERQAFVLIYTATKALIDGKDYNGKAIEDKAHIDISEIEKDPRGRFTKLYLKTQYLERWLSGAYDYKKD